MPAARPALVVAGRDVRVRGRVPAWAAALIERVAAAEGLELRALLWRRSGTRITVLSRGWEREDFVTEDGARGHTWQVVERRLVRPPKSLSSGRTTSAGRIVITEGSDPRDARVVLLHELAHLAVGVEHFHDERFWDAAFAYFRRYLPAEDLDYATRREGGYRRGASAAALRAGIAAS